MKTSKSELLHGVGYRTDDKSNELVEPPFIATKDYQEQKCGEAPVNNSMLQVSRSGTLFKRMSKLVNLVYKRNLGSFT